MTSRVPVLCAATDLFSYRRAGPMNLEQPKKKVIPQRVRRSGPEAGPIAQATKRDGVEAAVRCAHVARWQVRIV